MNRWLTVAACVCAFALPFTVAWVRDGSAESRTAEARAALTASAMTASASHVATPVVVRLPSQASNHAVDVTHAASMMVVGTLLIGIGSMVRRGL